MVRENESYREVLRSERNVSERKKLKKCFLDVMPMREFL
jgi:hypothetical protein